MTGAGGGLRDDPWQALAIESGSVGLAQTPDDVPSPDRALVVVLGAVGGAGASTLASGIALAVADRGAPVTLVDIDLERGDLAGQWGIPADRTIDDLLPVVHEIQPRHVDVVAHAHPSGVAVVLSPARVGARDQWTEEDAASLLRATAGSSHVVVDAGTSVSAAMRAACRCSTVVLVVAPATVSAARRAGVVRTIAAEWGAGSIELVVNRGTRRADIGVRSFARAAGYSTPRELPDSWREADQIASGQWPVGRRRSLAQAIDAITARIGVR